ncbi:GTPase ObgE [Tindallia californiensis]|uniref:GTPase Obg n=1 Tax=Tindallia californiensis TaxID=159292 RepID=A0A1H3NCJ6_9FIRM|nr:GTPase ObgE [Tindallia californiensis]SDY86606.1 GTP-binding protein [Tindallia californiensis]
MFIDQAEIQLKAGDGGNGIVAFRRETFVPDGGPSGGDGGKGGDIIFEADSNLRTLMDFRYKKKYEAERGEDGKNKNRFGRQGKDLIIKVPCGTMVISKDSDRLLIDLTEDGQQYLVTKGGQGGKGNARFKTSVRQAPQFATAGEKGESTEIILKLKLIADVGLVGFPNVGKSTLLSVITDAQPKIANYHFTTLTPNLGVVRTQWGNSFVVADIPGVIEGAHQGVGLGLDFLRHIERTRVLIHVVDIAGIEGRDPSEDFDRLNEELKQYEIDLSNRPQIIAANKADLISGVEITDQFIEDMQAKGYKVILISAATGMGTDELLKEVGVLLEKEEEKDKAVQAINEKEKQTKKVIRFSDQEEQGRFTVYKQNNIYHLEGELLRKLIYSLNLDSMDSLLHFYRVLQKNGVIKELKKLGIQEGDTVKIMDIEFDYVENPEEY